MRDWLFQLFTSGAFLILALYFSAPLFHLIQSRRDRARLYRRLGTGKLNPHGFQVRLELGEIYARSKRWSLAEQELRDAAKIDPEHAHCQSLLGIVLFHQRKYEEAIQHFQRALELRPSEGYGRTQVLLARSFEALEQPQDAETWYRAALERNLSICEPAYRLGLLLNHQGRKQGAKEIFEETIQRFSPLDRKNYWKNLYYSWLARFRLMSL